MQVLSIDDDVLVPCGEVAAAFAAWQRTADQMVGWFPRGHLLAADCTPRYLLRDAAVLLRGHYSMVLTKVAISATCLGLAGITSIAAVAARRLGDIHMHQLGLMHSLIA